LFPIVLGGSHELAYGHFNGIVNHLKKQTKNSSKVGIINFDAHFDLRPYDNQGSSGTMLKKQIHLELNMFLQKNSLNPIKIVFQLK